MSVNINSTVTEKLQEVVKIKNDIEQALKDKDQNMTGVKFSEYAAKVKAIEGGDKKAIIGEFIALRGTAASLFSGASTMTSDQLEAILPYDAFSNISNFSTMFNGCSSLTRVPLMDMSNATTIAYMFRSCNNIEGEIDLSNAGSAQKDGITDMNYVFAGAKKITSFISPKTENASNWVYTFNDCKNLQNISGLDVKGGVDQNVFNLTFSGCSKLENLSIKNINRTLNLSSCPLLSQNSLINIIQELRNPKQTNSSVTQVLTLNAASYEKIKSIRVKILNEDNNKNPFEICESADEDGTLITNYANSKNWNIVS